MIIEFFGPPGAGKTTLARMLTARLNELGYDAALWHSSRPAELRSFRWPRWFSQHLAPLRRLKRSIAETFSIVCRPQTNRQEIALAKWLLRMLPPRDLLARIREGQYICRMARAWYGAARVDKITVFDQGLVQELCSLILLSGNRDSEPVVAALHNLPLAHLLVFVDVSADLLKKRAMERLAGLRAIERFFERRVNPDFIPVSDELHRLLLAKGCVVIHASSSDEKATAISIALIEREVERQHGAVQLRSDKRGMA